MKLAEQKSGAENCFWADLFSTLAPLTTRGDVELKWKAVSTPAFKGNSSKFSRNYSSDTDL